ncbi:MAG: hypothetical protein HC821_05600 [Lewinella sp.]|nr:hypothetical protein [Lewinella sp.]
MLKVPLVSGHESTTLFFSSSDGTPAFGAFSAVWQYGEQWTWVLIPPALAIAGVLSLGPQIKWWYWQRRPPDLPLSLAPLLHKFTFYTSLDLAEKREFRRRTFLIQEKTQFLPQGMDKVPDDVAVMLAPRQPA